ncbi:MAG: hypothetical protein HQK49_06065, partial [Oligoflexia bacterium]|nr:hypothetical protein [Oligoflexia bacterium]
MTIVSEKILSLKDYELLEKTKKLVAVEKAQTLEVLAHLQEISRRRLFCDLGYSSLFEYTHRELGYSEA